MAKGKTASGHSQAARVQHAMKTSLFAMLTAIWVQQPITGHLGQDIGGFVLLVVSGCFWIMERD
jgi:hypothetical protein